MFKEMNNEHAFDDYMKTKNHIEKELDIVVYDPVLPPPRQPVDNGSELGFRDDKERQEQMDRCLKRVTEKCLEGARVGCSVKASKNCQVPWVFKLLGLQEESWQKRDFCETESIKKCMKDTKSQCSMHASEFCSIAFRNDV